MSKDDRSTAPSHDDESRVDDSVMHLNPVTLAFSGASGHLEQEFLETYNDQSLKQVRSSVVVGAVIIALFSVLDVFAVPDDMYSMWKIRAAVLIPVAILLVLLSAWKGVRRLFPFAQSSVLLMTGVGSIAMILRAPPPANFLYSGGLPLVVMFGFTVLRLRFIWGTIVGWAMVLIYAIAVGHFVESQRVFLLGNAFIFGTVNIIGMMASYSIERNTRRDFFLRKQLEKGKEEIRKTNAQLETRVHERTEILERVNTELTAEIAARKEAESNLKKSLAWREAIFEASRDAVFITGADSRFIDSNLAASVLTGYSRDELLRMRIPDLHAAADQSAYKIWFDRIMAGEDALSEAKTLRKDGTRVDTEFSNRRVVIDGMSYMHTTARDISPRKQAEENLHRTVLEKEMLLRELQHRVKNNLSIISSLLGLEMRRISDEKSRQVFREAQTRIFAMSTLYDQLFSSGDPGNIDLRGYLDRLAHTVFKTYVTDPGRITLTTELDQLLLDVKRAVPLGLIVNEMLTNAVKYAFPEGRGGEIRVVLREREGRVTLEIADNGVGLPANFDINSPGSMGLPLVKMLCEQIGGEMTVSGTGGCSVSTSFMK